VDRDDSIEENHNHENQQSERKVVQEWIADHALSPVNGAFIARTIGE
jgi:hypothetical protein